MKKHVITDFKTTSDLHNEAVDEQLRNYAAVTGVSCRLSGAETKIRTIKHSSTDPEKRTQPSSAMERF